MDTKDFFPTYVTAADAKNYINETNTAYLQLDNQIANAYIAKKISDTFRDNWNLQLQGWLTFRDENLSISQFAAKAVMEQTDRWVKELNDWATSFNEQAPGQSIGPLPNTPGQGIPTFNNDQQSVLMIAVIIGGIIGSGFAIGYLINSIRRK